MNLQNIKRIAVIGAMGLLIAGCQSWPGVTNQETPKPEYELKSDIFDFDGLPSREFLVGGGYFVSFRAPVEGELYIADDHTNRLLATISLQPGEKHEIIYDVNDEKLAANFAALGFDPESTVIKLYFVPR